MAHAFMSPSSSDRSYNCPASVIRSQTVERRVELLRQVGAEFYGLTGQDAEQFNRILDDDNSSSVDGTKLHTLFEDGVSKGYHLTKIKTTFEALNLSDADDFLLDMMCEIIINYTNWVKTLDSYALEKRVYVKGLTQYGTVDFHGVKGRKLYVHDLKTGRIEVVAENNYQLMTYGVAILDELGWDNFDEVELKIIGVRFDSNEHTVSVDELWDFKMNVMLPAFMDAHSINPTAKAGSWCQYCPAKLYCGEWNESLNQEVDTVFEDGLADVSNERLVELLALSKQFDKLAKGEVKTELLLRFDTLDEPVGVKRNSGKKKVIWASDEEKIVEGLSEELPDGEDLFAPKTLKTPTQVQKLLGDKSGMVDDYISVTIGKPYLTLVKSK